MPSEITNRGIGFAQSFDSPLLTPQIGSPPAWTDTLARESIGGGEGDARELPSVSMRCKVIQFYATRTGSFPNLSDVVSEILANYPTIFGAYAWGEDIWQQYISGVWTYFHNNNGINAAVPWGLTWGVDTPYSRLYSMWEYTSVFGPYPTGPGTFDDTTNPCGGCCTYIACPKPYPVNYNIWSSTTHGGSTSGYTPSLVTTGTITPAVPLLIFPPIGINPDNPPSGDLTDLATWYGYGRCFFIEFV